MPKVDSQSGLFLDSIVENIPDMIFVKDAKDLKFVRFNKAGEELLGYKRGDLLGKTDYDFFPKEEADFFTKKDREVLALGSVVDIPEEPIETRLRGVRVLHTKKIPILDSKGTPTHLLGISEDITEKKRLQAEIAENSKMAAVGRMAAGIAHEIRNPLFGISTVAQILIAEAGDKPEIRELARSMLDEIERVKNLLTDLLLYSKRRQLMYSAIRPKCLCEEIFKLHEHTLSLKGLKVLSCYSPEEAEVRIDVDQMRQVLHNLCLNALHAASQDSTIEIDSRVELKPRRWIFRVTNWGDLIPPETLPYVFEPFFTTRSEGTGLGLAISRGIIEDHGGNLSAQSDPRNGTSFSFSVPF
ncbi:MAG: ATP-binding protein [Pseudomonadota bacterium]